MSWCSDGMPGGSWWLGDSNESNVWPIQKGWLVEMTHMYLNVGFIYIYIVYIPICVCVYTFWMGLCNHHKPDLLFNLTAIRERRTWKKDFFCSTPRCKINGINIDPRRRHGSCVSGGAFLAWTWRRAMVKTDGFWYINLNSNNYRICGCLW